MEKRNELQPLYHFHETNNAIICLLVLDMQCIQYLLNIAEAGHTYSTDLIEI